MKELATADINSTQDSSGNLSGHSPAAPIAEVAGNAPMHLVLIDGSGFIFRAFHALPPMTRPDGTQVNAVFGFTNMLARLLKDHVGTHIAVIFDAGRTTFRNRLYDKYKAQRPPPPPELIPQFASSARRPRPSASPRSSCRTGRPTTSSPPTPVPRRTPAA